ncbi:LysR family transcriptional regulator [Pseudoramibacter sp.]|jgi:DNA-binding transcriptional LysR family regulator|uniref:LysR family transcriptional regulator n=1 Tax=Pseudoramibacter sp. TaxID=2034862 RepID=UPI0025E14F56|nr:LysR family transcriptional regulator [Pseudoramibacter sp.]MCH4071828.1 LysR family transcriptional regulator [Pseudoramibacter sp.]MCH4105597.1 LysR family transcriptional regulator [Pseudoramibacter sp.]
MLDFRVETFLTVCETLNFTAAARKLGLTQPAVSQHIHFLEKQYGTALFLYQNKQLALTPEGEILRARLTTMADDEKTLQAELRAQTFGLQSLAIGVTMTVGEYAIVDRLAAFIKAHPDLNVHLHYGNTAQLLSLLDSGQIRLAIVEGNYPRAQYARRTYSTEDYIAVCAPGHRFLSGPPQTLSDLIGERLLVREKGSGTRNILENILTARGLRIEDFIHYTEVENMHTLIGLLKRDCGITFLYKIAVEDELAAGGLVEIPVTDFKMQHNFDMIWRKDSIYSKENLEICKAFC